MSKETKEVTISVMMPVSVTMFVEFERNEYGEVEEFEIKRVRQINAGAVSERSVMERMSEDDYDYVREKIG